MIRSYFKIAWRNLWKSKGYSVINIGVYVAFMIASPIAWYIMNKWLQDFAYRVNISVWVFILTALLVVVTTIITVSFQAIKAAVANPVKSLRTE